MLKCNKEKVEMRKSAANKVLADCGVVITAGSHDLLSRKGKRGNGKMQDAEMRKLTLRIQELEMGECQIS